MSTNTGASKVTHIVAKDQAKSPAVTYLKAPSADKTSSKKSLSRIMAGDKRTAKPEVQFRVRFQKISTLIQKSFRNLDEVLFKLKDEIANLFESERVTIYGIDGVKRELVSRIMIGNDISEIRIPLGPQSLTGYAAYKQKVVNISNAYDKEELGKIAPDLKFDESWDQKTQFKTKQVLVCPIFFHRYLMGAIQLINRKNDKPYSPRYEKTLKELARIIGTVMYTQKRAARQRKSKYSYLLKKNLIVPDDLKRAAEKASKMRKSVEAILIEDFKLKKEVILSSLGQYYEVPTEIFNEEAQKPEELFILLKNRVAFLRQNVCVPLRQEDNKIIIAIDDPHNLQKIDSIKPLFPKNPLEFHVAMVDDILDYIALFTGRKRRSGAKEIDFDELSDELMAGIDDEAEIEGEIDQMDEESSAVVKLVNKIIIDSYKQNVSDIHVEPQPGRDNVRVRIRIDGSCQEYPMPIPYTYRAAIISRIKIMSGLDIAERRLPQDGKIQFKKYGGLDIELRVATIPTQGGIEDIVMRILAAGKPIPLKNMGFSERNFDEFMEIITQPYGIIFVCGPTGSGKTTTLHSALAEINKVETKIWTAEDPVEITQKGLRQVQMHPKIGLTFARAMRAFLRADPDVIMVGEMRDKETTSIGIEASLTGHLVFSTLHTNSAPESVIRLLDMGMDPFNFADAVLGIMAQRLVRTLCKNCKQEYHPSKEEFDELVREYGKDHFERDLAEKYSYTDDLILHKPNGCEKCNGTGYAGRMGIHELLTATDEQKQLIQSQATVEKMRNQAMKDGMRTLKMDGVAKVFYGYTDLIQVRKVCIN